MVFPDVLGSGFRLFESAEDLMNLKLIDVQHWPSGVVLLAYEHDRSQA